MRTTFLVIERPGVFISTEAAASCADSERAFDLIRRDKGHSLACTHRPGAWSLEALHSLAKRMGGVLVCAYSVSFEKGRFRSETKQDIYYRPAFTI